METVHSLRDLLFLKVHIQKGYRRKERRDGSPGALLLWVWSFSEAGAGAHNIQRKDFSLSECRERRDGSREDFRASTGRNAAAGLEGIESRSGAADMRASPEGLPASPCGGRWFYRGGWGSSVGAEPSIISSAWTYAPSTRLTM